MSQPQDPRQQSPQGQRPPGPAPQGQYPQGQRPPGAPPQGQYPQGQRPPGAPPQGQYPQGQRPPGAPGQYPQGQRPPGAPGQYPQGQRPPGAPGQYPQGQRPGGAKQKEPSKMLYWFSICSFVFGIVSLALWFLWFVPFFNLGYAVVAFLLGLSSIRRKGEYRGLAVVGVIAATITLLIIALFTLNRFLPNPIPFAETLMEFFTRNENFS